MLRITTTESVHTVRLVLEGRLAGPWVGEVAAAWEQAVAAADGHALEVDLREVLAVDDAGRALLAAMVRRGARLLACGCAMREVVREIAEAETSGAPAR